MKLAKFKAESGFTLVEMMVSVGLGAAILGATIGAAVALQKSFAAADDFFATHIQQIRIIDYLSRDVKRSLITTTSSDKQTVTCTIPNYVIATGDSDAGTANANVGKRRTPTVTTTSSGAVVDYQTGATTSTVVYSVTAVGSTQAIVRTENGTVTTIASSTDQLVPQSLDTELANTEYADTNVTFLPTFNFAPATSASATPTPSAKSGTAIFARSYMRNKRRG